MPLPSRVIERYKPADQLCGMAEWPELRVEQVRLGAGHLNPVTFQYNEIGFVLSGRTVTSYSGNGLKRRNLIQQGTARICPVGILEALISLPPGLIGARALQDYGIDTAKAARNLRRPREGHGTMGRSWSAMP